MRAFIVAALVMAAAVARADEPPIVTQHEIPRTSAVVPPPSPAEAAALRRSGRARLGAGIALVALGVLGAGASSAGSVVSIVAWARDDGGALKSTGQWLSIGGSIVEVAGLAAGIPLIVSGLHRLGEAQRPSL
jgi:hypothetical protein